MRILPKRGNLSYRPELDELISQISNQTNTKSMEEIERCAKRLQQVIRWAMEGRCTTVMRQNIVEEGIRFERKEISPSTRKSYTSLLIYWPTTGSVATVVDHPNSGSNQKFRGQPTDQELKQMLTKETGVASGFRHHVGMAYTTKKGKAEQQRNQKKRR